jgi:hypothetical protein
MLVANDRVAAALDASGLYTEERNRWLWEQIPAELRLVEFSPRTLPDHPAFRWKLTGVGSWRGFDLYTLPEPMQREFAYCFWQIIESGLTINPNYSQLAWWLIILGQDYHAAKRPPMRSLVDRSCAKWERELVKTRTKRTGKLGWTVNGHATVRRCLLASCDRLRPARVVAARHLEPEVRRANPDPNPRTEPGASCL